MMINVRKSCLHLKTLDLSYQSLALCFMSKDFPRSKSSTTTFKFVPSTKRYEKPLSAISLHTSTVVTDTAYDIACICKEDSNVPVIKFPISFKRKMMFKQAPKKTRSAKSALNLAKPGKILISSNNKSDNIYTNEFCSKFNPPTLTSSTWTSLKSPGRHFTIHPTRENPSLRIESSSSFEVLGLSQEILDVLRLNHIQHPTVIQAKAIPEISNGNNVMLAAETGSGKTLAYLLPILHHIMATRDNEHFPETSTSPLALILTPTRELVQQVLKMAISLELPVTCRSLASASKLKHFIKESERMAEILVATPVALMTAIKKGKFDMSRLKYAVVDECDTLLDDSFSRVVTTILRHFNIKHGVSSPLLGNQTAQLILSSATYPQYARHALQDVVSLDNIVAVRSGYLHRVSTHVKHRFLRVKPSEKFAEFIKVLEASKNVPTIVFCNFQRTAKWLHTACMENAIANLLIDGDLQPKIRSKRLKEFLEGDYLILITTDLLSRGLDTKRVEQVINYEVPDSVSDYLHRCGRVGRVGQQNPSSVTTLVSKKWEIPVVTQIEEAARRREEIGDVSANIKQQHATRWQSKETKKLEF